MCPWEGEHPVVVRRDDVPFEVAAGCTVDVGRVVSGRMHVEAVACDHLRAVVDVVENNLLHELWRWRRGLGSVEYLVPGPKHMALPSDRMSVRTSFSSCPLFTPSLYLYTRCTP